MDGASLACDYLVIALGADYAPDGIPGFAGTAHLIYDLASAVKLSDALAAFRAGAIAIGVSSLPFKCPAAPYETALVVDRLLETRGTRGKTRISFFTPEGLPLPSAGPDIGSGTLELLHARGIETRFKVKLTEVKPGSAVFDDGSSLAFDLLIAVPSHAVPRVVAGGRADGRDGLDPGRSRDDEDRP